MTELSLRPRSATELVDAAFQIYRRNPTPFILAAAVIWVPWLIISAIINPAPSTAVQVDPYRIGVVGIINFIVYTLVAGVVMLLARDVYLDRRVDVGGAFRDITRNVIPLVIATFLYSVAVAIGFVFFLIPGFYLLARFFAVRPVVVIEGAGIGKSFSRSAGLSVDAKGHILGTLILAWLVLLIVWIGVGTVLAIVPSRVAALVVTGLISIIVYPFVAIVEAVLYYDMRIRKEGFDIEYLSGVGQPAGVGGPTA